MYHAEREIFSEPLIDYLRHRGWALMESGPDIAVLRTIVNDQEEEIVLPRDRTFADYHQRVLEAVRFLAKIEHCCEKNIIDELLPQIGLVETNPDEVVKNWEQINAKEKSSRPKSILDGIPPTLPSVVRAQKILKRIQRAESRLAPKEPPSLATEEEAGEEMLALILRAENSGLDAESALRRSLARLDDTFRSEETHTASD